MFSKIILSLLAMTALLAAVPGKAANLTVTIREVRSSQGLVSVALFDSDLTFLVPGSQFRSVDIAARPGEILIVFKDVPPGRYAIAAFHDENASGDFDKGFLGIPKEGYGFSNDARAILSPPAFGDAAVSVERDTNTGVTISY